MAVDQARLIPSVSNEVGACVTERIGSLLLRLLGGDDPWNVIESKAVLIAKGQLWSHPAVKVTLLNDLEAATVPAILTICSGRAWAYPGWPVEDL
jgi:hypothetical protein